MKITMFYDGQCTLCRTEATRLHQKNPSEICIIPVDDAIDYLAQAGISYTQAMTYLCVQDEQGHWHTHMDAVRILYKTARIFGWYILYLPIIKQVLDISYPYFAKNRYRFPKWLVYLWYGFVKTGETACDNGVCRINPIFRQPNL